ncbi:MAG: fused MFS/spermidine synthase [Nitrospirae bacterium]|nr:fused MFS/spermidine synthase [Nitrospirota bacterium]
MSKSARIAGLLFLSGFCALVYQTVWLRELRLILGASTPATATVLAIFMGGLGVGGLVLGRRADRVKRPLAFYAYLEAGIAVLAAITPFVLDAGRSVYLGLGGTLVLGMFVGTIVRMVISVVVLIGPTFLMGGTLPAAGRAARSAADVSNKSLALLYGANTLGAVTGAVFSTFHLLEVLGNRRTLWIASLVNVVVFVLARSQSRKIETENDLEAVTERRAAEKVDVALTRSAFGSVPGWFILLAATVTGLVFFLMEIVWYRMLAPIMGGTTFTFGTILAVALLGIGIGGMLYAVRPNRRPSLSSFAWTCALEAFFLIIPFALGDRIADAALALRTLGFVGFWGFVAGWAFIAVLVVFPVSLIAGYQFPLLISLLNPEDERFAWKIGLTYGFNTAGCIAGSLLGGFGLLPFLTAPGVWKLTAILLAGLSLVSLFVAFEKRITRLSPVSTALFGIVVLAVVLSFSEGPTAVWRHSGIGAGRAYLLTEKTPFNQYQIWKRESREGILREWDGVESSVALSTYGGLAFLVNGKSDGHTLNDAGTQIMAGIIAALLHDNPKTSFVVGLGTGSTAGWLAAVPSMERVDVAEIEPVIVKVAEACAPVNHGAMKNPKINVIIGDGREIIMSSPRKYDVIASEPSNPYRAGISSLFTLDFYRSVASRLNPRGIFVHWVQAYEIDANSIWTIYTTLTEVFPYVETWHTAGGDITLVASREPFQFDIPKLRSRIASQPYSDALRYAWHVDSIEGFLARRIAGTELAQKIHSLPVKTVNTDDQNHLEFDFARSVGTNRNFSAEQIYEEGRKFPDFRAPLANGAVDETEVERRRLKMIPFAQRDVSVIKAEEGKTKVDLDQAVLSGNWTLARQILRANGDRLPFDTNRALLPIVFIESNDPGTERAITNHRQYSPEEAIALTALYSVKRQQWDRALATSLEFIALLRKNPWPSELVVGTLFSRFSVIAKNAEGGTGRLMEALLDGPFAVYAYDKQRFLTAFILAKSDAGNDHCTLLKKQRYYFDVGNLEYLKYLYNCKDNDQSMKKRIAEEIDQVTEGQSKSFLQIMEYLSYEAQKK